MRLKVIARLDGEVELAGDLVCIPEGGRVGASAAVEKRSNLETVIVTVYGHTVAVLQEVKTEMPDFTVLSG